MRLLYKMRQRFGRFAVRGLTRYIIATYIIGYLITFLSSAMRTDILGMLTLVPSSILQGEIWRIFTWILTPPGSLSFFTVIMLFVYYQLGSVLERVWGDYFYNLFYLFRIDLHGDRGFYPAFCRVRGLYYLFQRGNVLYVLRKPFDLPRICIYIPGTADAAFLYHTDQDQVSGCLRCCLSCLQYCTFQILVHRSTDHLFAGSGDYTLDTAFLCKKAAEGP